MPLTRSRVFLAGAVLTSLAAIAACGGSPTRSGTFDESADPTEPGAQDTKDVFESGDGGTTKLPTEDENLPSEVWGHSKDTLYKLDPLTKAVSVIGKFSGCSDVTDLALDGASNMYATTKTALYEISKSNAKCTKIADGTYPNSLSFVPKGTIETDSEVLVGFVDADYVRIDTATGDLTTIKSNAIGSSLVSSGDVVSVKNGGTYLTVRSSATSTKSKCSTSDCLVEINPSTGALKKNFGELGHKQVFGLAYWAGKAYGFDSSGSLFEIDFSGSTAKTTDISIADKPSALSFWGAGSTTSVPLTAPTN